MGKARAQASPSLVQNTLQMSVDPQQVQWCLQPLLPSHEPNVQYLNADEKTSRRVSSATRLAALPTCPCTGPEKESGRGRQRGDSRTSSWRRLPALSAFGEMASTSAS
eukprot:748996-Hanusia_phi.AAC.2